MKASYPNSSIGFERKDDALMYFNEFIHALSTELYEDDEFYVATIDGYQFARKKLGAWVNGSSFKFLIYIEDHYAFLKKLGAEKIKHRIDKSTAPPHLKGTWLPLDRARILARSFGLDRRLIPILSFDKVTKVKYSGLNFYEFFFLYDWQRSFRVLRKCEASPSKDLINLDAVMKVYCAIHNNNKPNDQLKKELWNEYLKKSFKVLVTHYNQNPIVGGKWVQLTQALESLEKINVADYLEPIINFSKFPGTRANNQINHKIWNNQLAPLYRSVFKPTKDDITGKKNTQSDYHGFPIEFKPLNGKLLAYIERSPRISLPVLTKSIKQTGRENTFIKVYIIYRRFSDGFVNILPLMGAATCSKMEALYLDLADPDQAKVQTEYLLYYRDQLCLFDTSVVSCEGAKRILNGKWCSTETAKEILKLINIPEDHKIWKLLEDSDQRFSLSEVRPPREESDMESEEDNFEIIEEKNSLSDDSVTLVDRNDSQPKREDNFSKEETSSRRWKKTSLADVVKWYQPDNIEADAHPQSPEEPDKSSKDAMKYDIRQKLIKRHMIVDSSEDEMVMHVKAKKTSNNSMPKKRMTLSMNQPIILKDDLIEDDDNLKAAKKPILNNDSESKRGMSQDSAQFDNVEVIDLSEEEEKHAGLVGKIGTSGNSYRVKSFSPQIYSSDNRYDDDEIQSIDRANLESINWRQDSPAAEDKRKVTNRAKQLRTSAASCIGLTLKGVSLKTNIPKTHSLTLDESKKLRIPSPLTDNEKAQGKKITLYLSKLQHHCKILNELVKSVAKNDIEQNQRIKSSSLAVSKYLLKALTFNQMTMKLFVHFDIFSKVEAIYKAFMWVMNDLDVLIKNWEQIINKEFSYQHLSMTTVRSRQTSRIDFLPQTTKSTTPKAQTESVPISKRNTFNQKIHEKVDLWANSSRNRTKSYVPKYNPKGGHDVWKPLPSVKPLNINSLSLKSSSNGGRPFSPRSASSAPHNQYLGNTGKGYNLDGSIDGNTIDYIYHFNDGHGGKNDETLKNAAREVYEVDNVSNICERSKLDTFETQEDNNFGNGDSQHRTKILLNNLHLDTVVNENRPKQNNITVRDRAIGRKEIAQKKGVANFYCSSDEDVDSDAENPYNVESFSHNFIGNAVNGQRPLKTKGNDIRVMEDNVKAKLATYCELGSVDTSQKHLGAQLMANFFDPITDNEGNELPDVLKVLSFLSGRKNL